MNTEVSINEQYLLTKTNVLTENIELVSCEWIAHMDAKQPIKLKFFPIIQVFLDN